MISTTATHARDESKCEGHVGASITPTTTTPVHTRSQLRTTVTSKELCRAESQRHTLTHDNTLSQTFTSSGPSNEKISHELAKMSTSPSEFSRQDALAPAALQMLAKHNTDHRERSSEQIYFGEGADTQEQSGKSTRTRAVATQPKKTADMSRATNAPSNEEIATPKTIDAQTECDEDKTSDKHAGESTPDTTGKSTRDTTHTLNTRAIVNTKKSFFSEKLPRLTWRENTSPGLVFLFREHCYERQTIATRLRKDIMSPAVSRAHTPRLPTPMPTPMPMAMPMATGAPMLSPGAYAYVWDEHEGTRIADVRGAFTTCQLRLRR